MPLFDTSEEAISPQNLLTQDGILVAGLLNGQPVTQLIRVNVDTQSEPGFILVDMQVLVNNRWLSTGTGRHNP